MKGHVAGYLDPEADTLPKTQSQTRPLDPEADIALDQEANTHSENQKQTPLPDPEADPPDPETDTP